MRLTARMTAAVLAAAMTAGLAGPARGEFVPWGPLVSDSWVCFDPADAKLIMHTVNNGDYEAGFDQAKNDDSARGMNALRFSYGGQQTGHLVSTDQAGSFTVVTRGNQSYTDLLILVAIDAASLPGGFAFSMAGRQFDVAADFGYYDPAGYDAGRPSGYYSVTDPPGSPVAYCLQTATVSIMALSNLSFDKNNPVAIDYAFENLPGTAVFSAYGKATNRDWIHHTNRGVIDANDPGMPVSTFEVVPGPSSLAMLACGATMILSALRPNRRQTDRNR